MLENLPEKAAKCLEKSKDVIANKNKKIKGMQQQIRRLREKVKSLEDLVEHLRNSKKLSSDEAEESLLVGQYGINAISV